MWIEIETHTGDGSVTELRIAAKHLSFTPKLIAFGNFSVIFCIRFFQSVYLICAYAVLSKSFTIRSQSFQSLPSFHTESH